MLFISGPAATDALTGINKYTFRSGRQSYQDVATAASFLPDLQGKKVTVFTQDNAFGQGNVAAVTSVFGAGGATVTPLLVPATATDLVPFAKQAADSGADLLFVAWAGTNATQMWEALNQQGAFDGVHRGHRARHQADPHRFSPRSPTSCACWPTTSTAPPTTRSSRHWSPGWPRRARPRTCSRRTGSTPR